MIGNLNLKVIGKQSQSYKVFIFSELWKYFIFLFNNTQVTSFYIPISLISLSLTYKFIFETNTAYLCEPFLQV